MATLTKTATKTAMSRRENSLFDCLRKLFPERANVDFSALNENLAEICALTRTEFGANGVKAVTEHLAKPRGKLEVALIGGTGAGKSTLFNALTGLRFGRVAWDDADAVSKNIIRFEADPNIHGGVVRIEVKYLTATEWREDCDLLRNDCEIGAAELIDIMRKFGYDTQGDQDELVERLEYDPVGDPKNLHSKFGEIKSYEYDSPELARTALNDFDDDSGIISEIKVTARCLQVTGNPDDKLPRGISLVDIPGLGDINPVRNNMYRRFLEKHKPCVFFLLSRDDLRISISGALNTFNYIDSSVGVDKITIVRTKWDGTRARQKVDNDLVVFKEILRAKYLQKFRDQWSGSGDDDEDVDPNIDTEFKELWEEEYLREIEDKIQQLQQLPATIREQEGSNVDLFPAEVCLEQYEKFDITKVHLKLRELAEHRGESLLVEISAVANGWLDFDSEGFSELTKKLCNSSRLRRRNKKIRTRAQGKATQVNVGNILRQQLDAFNSNHRGLKSILRQHGRGEGKVKTLDGVKRRIYIDIHAEMLTGFESSSRFVRLFARNLEHNILSSQPPHAVVAKIQELRLSMENELKTELRAAIAKIMDVAFVYVNGPKGMQNTIKNILNHYESKRTEIATSVANALVAIGERARDRFAQISQETLREFNRVERVLAKTENTPSQGTKRPHEGDNADSERERTNLKL